MKIYKINLYSPKKGYWTAVCSVMGRTIKKEFPTSQYGYNREEVKELIEDEMLLYVQKTIIDKTGVEIV